MALNKDLLKAIDITIQELRFQGANEYRINAYVKLRNIVAKYPTKIVAGEELRAYLGVGDGLMAHVNEWLINGPPKASDKLETYNELVDLVDIGPKLAKELVMQGVRSVADLKKLVKEGKVQLTQGAMLGLKYYKDIQQRIPRQEVEAIADVVSKTLPKMSVTVCGSYRRGLPDSGDIDILLCDYNLASEDEVSKSNVLSDVVKTLHAVGLLIDDLTPKPTTKYMGFCKLGKSGIVRRIDVRLVALESYIPALVYFTGSYEFNTMMRGIAKRKGFKLNEYALEKQGQAIDIHSEEHLFELLGMEYVPPNKR